MSPPSFISTAFPTAVGALVGAVVGVYGVRWQFNHESKDRTKARLSEEKERYETRLTSALADVLKEISIYARFSKSRIVTEAAQGDFDLIAAIDIALMIARDEDLRMIQALKSAILTDRRPPQQELDRKLSALSSEISDWRSKRRTFEHCYKHIEKWTVSKISETD